MSLYQNLYEALEHLAAPATAQVAWTKSRNVSIDELALDYDNAALAAWQLIETGEVTRAQHTAIASLLDDIVELGSHEADWTPAALHASAKWASIREKAKAILAQLAAPKHTA